MEEKYFHKDAFTVQAIGVIRSCYREKFGIPRQSGVVESAPATIELYTAFGGRETVRELEQFSHIWVHFLFHATVDQGWKRTVRPPGLGGKTRVGIYASRSPHRPNHMGLSVVRLLGIRLASEEVFLDVGGGDFLDNTPVLDIKPYIPYCDSIAEADGGYAGNISPPGTVVFTSTAERFCRQYEQATGRDLRTLIKEVIDHDPRPASQRQKEKVFGFLLWDVNVRWRVEQDSVVVLSCEANQES